MNPKIVQLTVAFVAFANIVWSQTPTRTVDVSKGDTPRSVTLSLAEYNRLIDLAGRPQPDARVAPIGAVVTNADLKVRVDRDAAHGIFALTGDVLRSGVNRVPLVSGATLMEGTTQGRTLPLAADNGVQSALIPGPGPFALTLEWGATVTLSPGRASFLLPVPLASTARATLDVPGDQADVRVSNGVDTRRTSADGRTTVEVTLRPAATTEVSWSMRDSAPVVATRELRYLADVFSLVTIGDSDVRLATLVDVSILAGELRSIPVSIPDGYEVTGVSGSSIESSEPRNGSVLLTMGDMAARRHQFLITMERPHTDGSFALDTGFPSLPEAQRERGEIAVEGTGTLELNAPQEAAAALLHRIDVRELNAALQSLSRTPLLVAFRYQRTPSAPAATLAMDIKRFGDAGVVAAIAERAAATTLVTTEGRALTEVRLTMQNRAQPFLKVALPQGATMVSVDVAGQPAKPVVGADGTRVPLLRPGFRPNGSYQVSFVYLYAGKPFAKKGDFQLTLPKIDVPIAIADWEVFVPEQFSVRAFDGNVIERSLTPGYSPVSAPVARVNPMPAENAQDFPDAAALSGQVRGRVFDSTGAVLPGVAVRFDAGASSQSVITGADGSYLLSNVPSGVVAVRADLAGFQSSRHDLLYNQQPRRVDFVLQIAGMTETLTVTATSPAVDTKSSSVSTTFRSDELSGSFSNVPREEKKEVSEPPSQNVINLQRRTAGVLPVRVDIPRAGTSHQFVKPLVVDQETTVSLRYKRR